MGVAGDVGCDDVIQAGYTLVRLATNPASLTTSSLGLQCPLNYGDYERIRQVLTGNRSIG